MAIVTNIEIVGPLNLAGILPKTRILTLISVIFLQSKFVHNQLARVHRRLLRVMVVLGAQLGLFVPPLGRAIDLNAAGTFTLAQFEVILRQL